MPTLYPTPTRLRLLNAIRGGEVQVTRPEGRWRFDHADPALRRPVNVTSRINEMLALGEPWIAVEDDPVQINAWQLTLTGLGERIVFSPEPAAVVAL